MRHLWLLVGLLTLIGSGAAQAASYLDIYGTVHDPIQNTYGGDSSYSGSNIEQDANLTGADLTDTNLNYADLSDADLTNANLTNASLINASLIAANLTDANLTGANLRGNIPESPNGPFSMGGSQVTSYLRNANLTNANLTDADLRFADLSNANLTNAWLYSANLEVTEDWSTAIWTGAKYSLNAVDNSGNPPTDPSPLSRTPVSPL